MSKRHLRFSDGHPGRPARALAFAAGLAAVGGWGGCLLHREPSPCLGDRDCKLERICDAGRCMWSRPGAPTAAAPRSPVVRTGENAAPPEVSATSAVAAAPTVAHPMFRFGPEHRGRSPWKIPARRPDVVWAYETRGPVTSSPVVTADGWVLVGSHDGKLHALDREGVSQW